MSSKLSFFRYAFVWALGLIALGFSASLLLAQDPIAEPLSHSEYIRTFYKTLSDNGGVPSRLANRKGLVSVFCSTIFDQKLVQGFAPTASDGSYLNSRLFSPKDSLFAFLLCNSLDGKLNVQSYISSLDAIDQKDEAIQSMKSAITLLTQQIEDEEQKENPSTSKLEAMATRRSNLLTNLANTLEFASPTNIPYLGANYIKKKQIGDFVKDNNCLWSTNLNSCSLSSYLSKAFNQIINDYTNSKIAGLYAYVNSLSTNEELNSKSLKAAAGQFSNYYFGNCGEEASDLIYINKDQIDGGVSSYCSHPNTYKVLSNYMQNAQSKTDDNVVVDYNLLLEQGTGTLLYRGLSTHCSQAGTTQITLDCGLDDFQHIVLNELLYYGLFMNFYSSYVTSSEQFAPLSIGKDKAITQEILDEEKRKAQLEIQVATQAIQQDFKIIRNLFAKFPIHIGLVAYLEDLVNLRDGLVDFFTPFDQLVKKTINAQTNAK